MTEQSLKNKRIIMLFGNLEMGGAERQGLILANHLKNVQNANLQIWGLGKRSGVAAGICDRWGIPWKSVWLHWGLRRRLPHLLRLAIQLKQARPEIIISYTKVPNIAAALLWRLCGARLCIWNQADAGLLLEPTWLHRMAIAQVSHFISNAEGGCRYLMDTFNLGQNQVRLIRNGVSLPGAADRRENWRRRLLVEEGQLLAVMVANLSRFKDHATLLEAWRLILTGDNGQNRPVLALAGRFDDRAEALKKQAEQLRIDDQVRFLGAVDDIAGLLQSADLAVHSSPSEGIPNAVLEAMHAGLPIAGSDIAGLREAVGEEGIPFLAEAGNPAALAAKLRLLLDDPELRAIQGQRMQQHAARFFGEARMCQETTDYLLEALMERPCQI